MSLAGIDIGTTGCKITVYDKEGNYLFRSYQQYKVSRYMGEHEIQVEAIWEAAKKIIKDATRIHKDIMAIGITSFGETCVLLDKSDVPIRPAILYTDSRGTEECEELVTKIGKQNIERITGLTPQRMYSIAKVMWIKKHAYEDYKRTSRILMMEDYIIYMLTGKAIIDYSLATRSMAFDITKLQWSNEIFDVAKIDSSLFSKPVMCGTDAGNIRKDLLKELGLSEETIVTPAGHDQVAAAIGSGVFDKNSAVDGAGTVECIVPIYDEIPDGSSMYEGNYAIIPYVIPGKYVTYAFTFTGGALVDWFVQNFAKNEAKTQGPNQKTVYEVLEEGMKEEPTGILVLPHFAGAATPYMDQYSKGAIVGLTVEHTTSDLYKAMMEGVCYEMLLNLQLLKKANIAPRKLFATGGGASSKVWMQMKADILNLPITALENSDAGATGCAMMAGIASGIYTDLKDAASTFIKDKETYYPRIDMHKMYLQHYERYEKLYEAVRPLVS